MVISKTESVAVLSYKFCLACASSPGDATIVAGFANNQAISLLPLQPITTLTFYSMTQACNSSLHTLSLHIGPFISQEFFRELLRSTFVQVKYNCPGLLKVNCSIATGEWDKSPEIQQELIRFSSVGVLPNIPSFAFAFPADIIGDSALTSLLAFFNVRELVVTPPTTCFISPQRRATICADLIRYIPSFTSVRKFGLPLELMASLYSLLREIATLPDCTEIEFDSGEQFYASMDLESRRTIAMALAFGSRDFHGTLSGIPLDIAELT
ncbi:uncharacterized protein EV420DRAFT_139529 [Desarmillaria tabescens]|uniref:Uncharacterized protein n=1 Tax=Armillaria tabescens TaxID=1929756 RepID=A0AA39NAF4_ARMTA|nr:uncharacterized protein EV420DRAFT_139529 [Desarmillaria tabescens]KAK0461979.1 hypothetical protein EV420DRAFT_139529 [Desarmillaria tabescens]